METRTKRSRTRAYLRLRPFLINRLKEEAYNQNISFNSYVESILMAAVSETPNAETLAAIDESKRGEYAGTIDLSSMEAFRKSMGI